MQRSQSELKSKQSTYRRVITFLLVLLFAFTGPLLLASCDSEDAGDVVVEDYGAYGMQLAYRFSNNNTFREPYSQAEYATGDMIIDELESLGYQPEIQTFSVSREEGLSGSSRNVVVRLNGDGFYNDEELRAYQSRNQGQQDEGTSSRARPEVYRKQVIIGTHYDSPTVGESAETMSSFGGISGNSSGIAAVMTLANALVNEETSYDVVIVFFGAGNDDYQGARHYLSTMTEDERERTDAVYTVQNIYAGDKLYAHAGHSSLIEGRKYEMRRKLYEATDVALENNLRTTMGVDLVINQGGYMVDVPGYEARHVYREFTLNRGDYVPFDEVGIPVVFFESAEYDVDSLAEVTESEHPAFEETGGIVSGTGFDNTYTLRVSLGTDILQDRINATAFILVQAIHKGSFSFTPVSDVELNS